MSGISIDSSNNVPRSKSQEIPKNNPNVCAAFLSVIATSFAVSVGTTAYLVNPYVLPYGLTLALVPCDDLSQSRTYENDKSICKPIASTYTDKTVSPETFPKVEFSKRSSNETKAKTITAKTTSKTAKIK